MYFPQELGQSPERPSLANTLSNLATAYNQHQAGEAVNGRLIAKDLNNLFDQVGSRHLQNKDVRLIFQQCGPLAAGFIDNPKISAIVYPPRKKRGPVKTALMGGALGFTAAAAAIGGTVGFEALQLQSKGGPAPIHFDAESIFKSSDQVIPIDQVANEDSTKPENDDQKEPAQTTPSPSPTAQNSPTPSPSPSPSPSSTASPTKEPTATPTVNPAEQAKKEIGSINMGEYLLGDLVKKLVQARQERVKTDQAYTERIDKRFLNAETINFVYSGIDNTRERPAEFNTRGWGRSDVTILVTINHKTLQVNAISFPRDMFAPELTRFHFTGGARINAATMTPYVDSKVDSFVLVRRIIESATGIPVDGVFKTNVDFTQGHTEKGKGYAGFFDSVLPQGLNITLPYDISDDEYPTANYGSKKVFFAKGPHVFNGRQLTEAARSRHGSSDFGRSEMQRLILQSVMLQLSPDFIKDFAAGNTTTLDKIISALEKQEQYTNLSYDLNWVEILRTAKKGVEDLRSSPKGLATLAILAANSRDIKPHVNSIGLTRANVIANIEEDEPFYWAYMLKVAKASTTSNPTALGNYLTYWDTIRKFVAKS
ncbi:LCP family protein, partial [Patescibacteria group bacterium]|nr:LCP family protein [Patescibacteria group bacterium]